MATRSRQRTGRRALRVAAGGLAVGGMVAGVGVAAAAQQAAPANVAATSTNEWSPADVTINTGETVTWSWNNTGQPHNVKGVSGPAADPAWPQYTTPITQAGSATRPFGQPGTYTFVCQAHPVTMTGTVTVVGDPVETPTPTPTPTTSPTPSPTPPPAPTPDPGPSGQTPPAPGDTTPAPGAAARDSGAPALSGLRVKGIRRGARLTFNLSETASVTVRFKKRKSRKVVRTARRQVRAGKRTITVRGGRLRRGRYRVEVEARDAGGNRTQMQKVSVRIKRARG